MEDSVFNHSSSDFANSVLDAVEIIVDRYVTQAKFDKTIQATIISCTNSAKGEYQCKYQDSKFLAYSPQPDITYSEDTLVYILIPGNDWDAIKTIIGTVEKLGENYASNITQRNYFDTIGDNILDNPSIEVQMSTWEGTKYYPLYNLLNLNTTKVEEYIKQNSHIKLQADVKSNIDNRQTLGQYGFRIVVGVPNSNQARTYFLKSTDMLGNPNLYENYITQSIILPLDVEHFGEILSIDAFVENYSTKAEPPIDVWMKNFSITAQQELTEAQMVGGYLSFETPNGSIFFINPYGQPTPNLITLLAKIRLDGIVINDAGIQYYWFKQDARVYRGSLYEDDLCSLPSIDTQGWKCLNASYLDNGRRVWNSATNVLDIQASQVIARQQTYRCIAIYNDLILDNTITVENRASNYIINIESSDGTVFYKDSGSTQLSCVIDSGVLPQPAYPSYHWASYSNTQVFNTYNWEQTSDTIEAISIIRFTKFICTVYDGPDYIGTGEIILYNQDTTAAGTYQLGIKNGDQMFKYDVDGQSPISAEKEPKQLLNQLELEFFDNLGQQIPNATVLSSSVIKWYFPKSNVSMLETVSTPTTEEEDYYIYEQLDVLPFTIKQDFDYTLTTNQIKLTVEYNGNTYMAYTAFFFTKEGDIGTNGTKYSCRITPKSTTLFTDSRVFIRELSNGNWSFNFTPEDIQYPFKVEVYRNAEKIFDNYQSGTTIDGTISVSLTWEICGDSSNAFYSITSGGQFSYIGFPQIQTQPFDNILKVTVHIEEQDGKTIFAFLPIGVVKNYDARLDLTDIGLKKHNNSYVGFAQVLYNNDGDNPQYTWNQDFEVQVPEGYTVIRSTFGDSLFISNNKIYPMDHYTGLDVNNAVIFDCTGNQGNIFIYCPIAFTINRYGLAALNAWDGTHIKINDEEDGYIYAPQLGAGQKESDNSFTGVLLGKVKMANTDPEIGLLAYGHGTRTVFIDANTGIAKFGSANKGQIIIDPTQETAMIYGGNYSTTLRTGMLIDLTTPCIKFGSGNFMVGPDGKIAALSMELHRPSNDSLYYQLDQYGLLIDVGSTGDYPYPSDKIPSASHRKLVLFDSDTNPNASAVSSGKTNAIAEFGDDGVILQCLQTSSYLKMKQGIDETDNGWNVAFKSGNALYLESGIQSGHGPSGDGEDGVTNASVSIKSAYNANIWAGHGLSLHVTRPSDNSKYPDAVRDDTYGYMKLETQYGWMYMSNKAGGKKNTPGIGINAYTWASRQNLWDEELDPYPGRDYKVYINGNEVLDTGNAAEATGGDLGGAVYVSEFGNLRPYLDNMVSLGSYYEEGDGIAAWRHVVTYDTVTVSDRREKDKIQDMDKRYVDLIMNLKPKKYKYLKTREDEYRTGFIAQEVEDAIEDVGLRNKDFGGLKKKPIIMEGETVDYGYGLNYDDFVAALVLTVQDLQKQINELKGELNNGTRTIKK